MVLAMCVSYIVFNKDYFFILSLFAGGISALVPNAMFALYFFRYYGAKNASKALNNIYLAEAIKFILVFGFLIASYSSGFFEPKVVFIGFIIVYFSVIFIALFIKK